MSSVVISGNTSGAITLSAPNVAGTNTITLPAVTGTMLTTASAGTVLQVVSGQLFSDRITISSSTFTPVGSGVSITPTSASSKILVTVCYSVDIAHECSIGRGANYNIPNITHGLLTYSGSVWGNESFFYYDSPASTSSQTYYLTARGYNGSTTSVYFSDFSLNAGPFGYMTLMEIAA
jgi:hypothetical protein